MTENKEVKFHEEIKKMEYEPLDPIELKLVRGGIALGVVLLVAMYLISKFVIGAH